MPTCPNGHQSGSDDWCEVCGHRMAGAVPPPPPPPPPAAGYGYPQGGQTPPPGYGYPPPGNAGQSAPPPPGAGPELCPQCRTPREGGAPFCEECRWNFLTNTATSYTPAAPNPPAPGPGPGQGPVGPNPALRFQQPPGPGDSFEYQGSRPSQMNRPAEPIPPFGGGPAQAPPPPPGPRTGGAPQAFQQPGPPAPPAFPQETGHPQGPPPPPPGPSGPSFGGGDDWVLSPPSAPAQQGQGPGATEAPGGPQGFPPPQQTQAPQAPQGFQQQQPVSWSATIGPDREYFMAMMHRSGPEASGLNLPAYSPEQQRRLTGNQMTIGRRRHSTGDTPDIDLSVPPEDPGVSHQHAVLVQQPDGSWAVVDQNSTNGTTVNGGDEPIQPFVPVPLHDGDRVHVGAWTTITIHRG
ncbi:MULTISPECIES: FHA domain-containing protein [unclassified Streptomyces]|uniref:FHA domain-containing protein n=1 Tax=Streptomyces sp. NBC_00119 TaxID=2975659 RepID=A0AAU1UEJ9_9ACTN|nr:MULTISPECIES: FHA domain-containing protein [unclassified Streptomyces]MCX4645405.1 FHA domain-containing protein [Streptomyces sp. NBC_01446]MCX5325827.1 FHA domain-containing protein [Streptomyces sp. NBC_00120]